MPGPNFNPKSTGCVCFRTMVLQQSICFHGQKASLVRKSFICNKSVTAGGPILLPNSGFPVRRRAMSAGGWDVL